MKFIILSGAGLSAQSGLPLYETLINDKNYTDFFESDAEKALQIAKNYFSSYHKAQANTAHHECFKIQEFCKAFGIDFNHYTLNVDNLSEQAGSTVTHLYGCVDDLEDLVATRKHGACVDLHGIDWQEGDVLIVLGVSNTGFPLAFLESKVLVAGAIMLNYNIEHNAELSCQQFIGSVHKELKGVLALSFLDLVFEEYDFGNHTADEIRFTLYGREYTTFFSPTLEHRPFADELEIIQLATGEVATDRSSEVKFDLVDNVDNEAHFVKPNGDFTYRELSMLGFIIVALICSHDKMKDVDMYTAAAADLKLVIYYNRLAKKYAKQLDYRQWCAFGPNGDNYAFKK